MRWLFFVIANDFLGGFHVNFGTVEWEETGSPFWELVINRKVKRNTERVSTGQVVIIASF